MQPLILLSITVSYPNNYNNNILTDSFNTTLCNIITVNCGDPLAAINDSTLRIADYNDELTLEGTTVNYTCPTGLILNGTSQSTCMSDGQWKPDPREVACVGSFLCKFTDS